MGGSCCSWFGIHFQSVCCCAVYPFIQSGQTISEKNKKWCSLAFHLVFSVHCFWYIFISPFGIWHIRKMPARMRAEFSFSEFYTFSTIWITKFRSAFAARHYKMKLIKSFGAKDRPTEDSHLVPIFHVLSILSITILIEMTETFPSLLWRNSIFFFDCQIDPNVNTTHFY